MKIRVILLVNLLLSASLWAEFDFGECQGAKSFEQYIEQYDGDYENAVTVGKIPKGIKGLKITLTSDKDVDIRIYGENDYKIVHWPRGLLHSSVAGSATYKGVNVQYSGFDGVNGQQGHEYINIVGTLPVEMTMKAFGYKSGNAVVNYSWTGKDGCTAAGGEGSFAQEVKYKDIVKVGDIPAEVNGFEVYLNSNIDLDIQLYGEDGTAIIAWPRGLLHGPGLQTIDYHGMHIEWSGFNGTNGHRGNEYIKVTGKTTEPITMKVYGYQAGYADISYSWQSNNKRPVALSQTIDIDNVSNSNSIILSGTDQDNDTLTYSITSQPLHGVLSGTAPNLQYTPNSDYTGSDSFKFKVNDGIDESLEATVQINISQETVQLPLLLVRIEFNDYQFMNGSDTWNSKIFGNASGQLNSYYNEVSYGKFQFKEANESNGVVNDGIITVHLNRNHPGNTGFSTLAREAISIADDYVDFSAYDANNNGSLSRDELQIMFLVAGGEKSLGMSTGIWARSSCLNPFEAPLYDGKKIMNCNSNGSYSAFGERHWNHDATIGVIAHELGHAVFRLRDLYDLDQSSEGIGIFGLMSTGAWGKKQGEYLGQTPIHMIAWSKLKAGFVTPVVVSSDKTNLDFKSASTNGYKVYKILTNNSNEYFLAENREATGYDIGLAALDGGSVGRGGLLITHINDNKYGNWDDSHRLVDVEEANNAGLDQSVHRGHINNLFFSGNVDSFSGSSTPNSNLNNGQSSGISITNISESGETMTADIHID